MFNLVRILVVSLCHLIIKAADYTRLNSEQQSPGRRLVSNEEVMSY